MNKHLFFVVLIALSASAFAQPTRQLVIRGEAKLMVSPDQAVLSVTLNTQEMEFNKAIARLSEREKDVIKKLEKLGYKKEQIKTSDFSVYENRVWWEGRSYDSGYVARQSMALEFVNTKEKISEILNAFGASTTEAEISFAFGLSDDLEKKKQEEVIKLAIADAKQKAELIAVASGVTLGGVLKIDYHTEQIGVNPVPMMDYRMKSEMDAAQSEGFEAKEIILFDGVVISFELK